MEDALAPIYEIFDESQSETIEKGKLVYYRNEVPRKASILTSGTIRVYNLNANETERNIALLNAGDLLPFECILGKDKSCRYFYESTSKITLKSISLKKLKDEIENNTELMRALFEQTSSAYLASLIQIEAFGQHKVREKILYILRYLLQRHGTDQGSGWWEVDARLTHNDIANMIGITRETVASELSKLKKEDIVSYKKFRYSLNLPALTAMTNANDWKSFTGA